MHARWVSLVQSRNDRDRVELTSAVIVYLAPRIRSGCHSPTARSAYTAGETATGEAAHRHVVARAAKGARHAVDELPRDAEIAQLDEA